MDTLKFLEDKQVEHTTQHHHCTYGNVQIHCPFCGKTNFHLGISLTGNKAHCWSCGGHSIVNIIKELLKCSYHEANNVILEYSGVSTSPKKEKKSIYASEIHLPRSSPLLPYHEKYLRKRKFSPGELSIIWGLKSTGPIGPYKHRIIIPVYFNHKLVTYTSRDVTEKSTLRYKNCNEEDEVRSIKHCLYGIDKVVGKKVVVVEGPTDVWRLGPGSVCTFGITWSKTQAKLLAERFEEIFILFDSETNAQKQAKKLGDILSMLGRVVSIINLEHGDPGELPEAEAKNLMAELLKK